MSKNFPILFLCGLFLSACQKEISLPEPAFQPEIVVFGEIYAEDAEIVLVSTRRFNDPNDQQIYLDSAQVLISGPNGTDTLAEVNAGRYLLQAKTFVPGVEYKLDAFKAGFPAVSGSCILPKNQTISKASSEIISAVAGDFPDLLEYKIAVTVELSDLPDSEAFYSLDFLVQTEEKVEQPDGDTLLVNSEYFPTRLTADSPNNLSFLSPIRKFVFKKSDLAAGTKRLVFSGEFTLRTSEKPIHSQVELRSFSQPYYQYLYSLQRQANYSPEVPITEPELIYSNINGGFGYFSGFQITRLSVPIQ